MLHNINLPPCTQHLTWVVQLQSDLLHALCDPNICRTDITLDWVKALRPDLDGVWVENFCGWTKKGNSILTRMQAVAALTAAEKHILITHYEINLRFSDAFDETMPPPPPTKPLPAGLTDGVASAYVDFFEMFYAPVMYSTKGYPINSADLNGARFSKDKYLEVYRTVNPNLKVCPLCDGVMDGAEMDHWLAQKHLPELNCHPQNLLEICGACNRRTNKGELLTLDAGEAEPFANWFHPHLRPALGHFEIRIDLGVPMLASNDALEQVRLDKLDGVIKLKKRWTVEYRNQFKGIQQRIRNQRRFGKVYDQETLRAHLESWKIDAEGEQGIREHKLLEARLLDLTLADGSDSFVELLRYATA